MTEQLTLEVIDQNAFSSDALTPIAELLCLVWPKPGRTVASRVRTMTREIESADEEMSPRGYVVRENGAAIAFGQMLPRLIGSAEGDVAIAGLARVCTHPDHRGRGLGERVVRAAFELIDQGDFRASLFQTSPAVRPFYERLGCAQVDNRIVNSGGDDPDANPFWDEVVMRYPAKGRWPNGTIDLRGPGY